MARTNVIDEYVLARLHLGMKIVDAIKVFFKGRKAAVNTALSASMAADNAFSDALDAISPYSKLSIRRDAISTALRNLEEKMTQARLDEYNEQIRDADPAEVAAYSRAELDAHTAAIEALDAAFDAVTESVANLNSGNEIYDLSVAFREASREAYVGAAMAYLIAARRAEIDAAKGNLLVTKNRKEEMILQISAEHADEASRAVKYAKLAAAIAKTDEIEADAELLRLRAIAASSKAEVFLAKANRL